MILGYIFLCEETLDKTPFLNYYEKQRDYCVTYMLACSRSSAVSTRVAVPGTRSLQGLFSIFAKEHVRNQQRNASFLAPPSSLRHLVLYIGFIIDIRVALSAWACVNH